ncbi:TraR/DksA C4-type zinc finger protein [Clostridium tyrobutyricum]|uniref:TraR/DksA C4-type zinc finger protein n=1 Tax=Clostridium tyrobutyricum TaxID=1519 RepID=UPI001C38A968|nr:TraR/DksA C4-type zinc finger protein [Clostridium tyrobutyricum]MBV4427445.1 TraR/DksA C4-type zinc finger protein [Clostridium tyrobutyricum]MBV4443747.1 TraR/DksA C4-type zinc finger protein [Clostridium tyrobutyricum]
MDNRLLKSLKNKLKSQRDETCDLLEQMERNETIKSNTEMSSELSVYDNHPADSASSIYDKERGMAFQKNEEIIINKIDNALQRMAQGTYGICKKCGKEIDRNRLKYVPYAEYCIHCQDNIDDSKPDEMKNRPPEEEVLKYTMNHGGYDNHKDEVGFDAEDSYQAVGKFNRRENIVEEYEDEDEEYVEPIEKISNTQYKNQLP